jgi:hypothetical protein
MLVDLLDDITTLEAQLACAVGALEKVRILYSDDGLGNAVGKIAREALNALSALERKE